MYAIRSYYEYRVPVPGDEYLALVDDMGLVGYLERVAHVVVGDQHAYALVRQPADDALDLVHGYRVSYNFV